MFAACELTVLSLMRKILIHCAIFITKWRLIKLLESGEVSMGVAAKVGKRCRAFLPLGGFELLHNFLASLSKLTFIVLKDFHDRLSRLGLHIEPLWTKSRGLKLRLEYSFHLVIL